MCEITNLESALENFQELLSNVKRHKKSFEGAKAKLDLAKAIIEEECADGVSAFIVKTSAGTLKVGSKRKIQKVLTGATIDALEDVKEGLSLALAEYKLGTIKPYLSPMQLETVCETSYGARTLYTFVGDE